MKKKKFPPRFCSYNNEFVEFSANEIRGGKKERKGGGEFSMKEILSVAARAIGRRANANINPN